VLEWLQTKERTMYWNNCVCSYMNKPGSELQKKYGEKNRNWKRKGAERGWRPIETEIMCIFVHATCPKGTARLLTQPIRSGINKWFHKGRKKRKASGSEMKWKPPQRSWKHHSRRHTYSSRGDGDPKSKRPYKRSRWRTGHQTDPAGVLRNVRLKIKSKTRLCHMGAWDTSIYIHTYPTEPRRFPESPN